MPRSRANLLLRRSVTGSVAAPVSCATGPWRERQRRDGGAPLSGKPTRSRDPGGRLLGTRSAMAPQDLFCICLGIHSIYLEKKPAKRDTFYHDQTIGPDLTTPITAVDNHVDAAREFTTPICMPERHMRYRVLGPLQFWNEDRGWLTIRSAKGRILLASLLAQPNISVSKELISQHLWTEIAPPRSAPKLIHFYVHQVRRAIGDHRCSMLRTSPSGYKLTMRSGDRDIDVFLEAAARGRAELRAGHLPQAADWFRQGLLLWHGSPYLDLLETELGRIESATLIEQLLLVKEATFDIALRVGRHEEIIPELRGLVLAHPLRERFYEQLMAAQQIAGRRVDALRTFDDLRCVLGRELGITPGRVAQELHGLLLMNPPDAAAVVRSALGVSAPPP